MSIGTEVAPTVIVIVPVPMLVASANTAVDAECDAARRLTWTP